jgi:hypothetical protein
MGSVFGAQLDKNLAVFIDDMQMPHIDQYGTRQPIALLLTLLNHRFYHSCKNGRYSTKDCKRNPNGWCYDAYVNGRGLFRPKIYFKV